MSDCSTHTYDVPLKPCPFCGGEAYHYAPGPIEHHIACKNYKECGADIERDTEAEAIAAWNSRADYHGYEQAAIEAWESIKAWNAHATNGTLTAEQVRETVEKHWHDLSADYDMPEATALSEYSYDWHAIADELNSRAERTCRIVEYADAQFPVCSECGAVQPDDYTVYYCWNCGAKVLRNTPKCSETTMKVVGE